MDKKTFFEKAGDVANFWGSQDPVPDFSNKKFLLSLVRSLGKIFLFIISMIMPLLGLVFLSSPVLDLLHLTKFNQTIFETITSSLIGIFLLAVSVGVAYFLFKMDLENNFKMLFNNNEASLKCPHCDKKNKLKINYLKLKI